MIRLVSASSERYFNSTGAPTRMRTVGGSLSVEDVRQPARAGPHLLRAPQPDRDHRRLRQLGEPGHAPSPLQLGLEERRPAGDRPLRHDRHHLAAGERIGGGLERLVGPGRPVDADAAERVAS